MDNYKRAHAAVIAYTLNLIDLFCTLWALRHGAVELNPLMQSVTVMVGYKVIIVGGAAVVALYPAGAGGAVCALRRRRDLRCGGRVPYNQYFTIRRATWTKPLTICLRQRL